MIRYTKTAEIAISSLHPLDKERTENLILRLEQYPTLVESAALLQSSRHIRILPISTELVLLVDTQNGIVTIHDVTTPRRLGSVDRQATAI